MTTRHGPEYVGYHRAGSAPSPAEPDLRRHEPRVRQPGPDRRCAMRYLKRRSTNDAGGFAWAVDDWARLRRWLILGCDGGNSTPPSGRSPSRTPGGRGCLAPERPGGGGIARVSDEGRAPKNEPAIFALAMAAGLGDQPAASRARGGPEGLPHRNGPVPLRTFVEGFRGGAAAPAADQAAGPRPGRSTGVGYQAIKYRQRRRVTRRDSCGSPTRRADPETRCHSTAGGRRRAAALFAGSAARRDDRRRRSLESAARSSPYQRPRRTG